jgi:hypothetical protein
MKLASPLATQEITNSVFLIVMMNNTVLAKRNKL